MSKWEKRNIVFNSIAVLIRVLIDKVSKDQLIGYECTDLYDLQHDSNLAIIEFEGLLYDENGTLHIEENESWDKLIETIESFLNKPDEQKEISEMLLFLQYMDNAMQKVFDNCRTEFELGEFRYLNSNVDETGIGIVPKCICRWMQLSADKNRSHEVNNLLKNFYAINLVELGKFQIVHHFIDSREFIDKEVLNIGVSPLWKWESYHSEHVKIKSEKVINPSYQSDMEMENRIILKTLQEASEKELDIIVFPEMHGNVKTCEVVTKHILMTRRLYRYPALIVLPSIWNDGKNYAYTISGKGKILFQQEKRTRFISKEKAYENLSLSERPEIHVLHIQGIGRILVMICRDFLERDELELLLKHTKATMILVSAYSTGLHDFERVSGICCAYECSVVLINSCAGYKNGDLLGFIERAGHSVPEGENKIVKINPCERFDNIGESCQYCREYCCLFTTQMNCRRINL